MNIGLQIYTLRNEIHRGYDDVFGRLAAIGYKGIEMTYSPNDGDVVRDMLAKHNLVGTGAHIGIDAIENDYATVRGFLDKIGTKRAIMPWISPELVSDMQKTKEVSKRLNKGAKRLADDGYEFGFHNHVVEYEDKFGGTNIIDIFMEEAPELKFEIDAGWAFVAGVDIVGYIKKMNKRLMIVHVKDIDSNNTPVEIGTGRVDYKKILDEAAKIGVEWGVVEQDGMNKYEAFESVKISYDHLKTIV